MRKTNPCTWATCSKRSARRPPSSRWRRDLDRIGDTVSGTAVFVRRWSCSSEHILHAQASWRSIHWRSTHRSANICFATPMLGSNTQMKTHVSYPEQPPRTKARETQCASRPSKPNDLFYPNSRRRTLTIYSISSQTLRLLSFMIVAHFQTNPKPNKLSKGTSSKYGKFRF